MTSLLLPFLFLSLTLSQPPSLPSHPRLILSPDRIRTLQSLITTDSMASGFYHDLIQHANWVLTRPPIPEPPSGPSGVLDQVRQSLDYMLTSALAYVLSENVTFRDRAVKEATNIAVDWRDWNSQNHFLDTGEAMTGVALVLDWVYKGLEQSQREALVKGMVSKGMEPFRSAYANHSQFWINNTINWNCVCAGGGIIGSLAIVDEPTAPTWLWSDVYVPSLASIPKCIGAYGPEGSWMEGVNYWGYASKYNVFTITSLQSALGPTVASTLYSLPGVSVAGTFPVYMTGASGQHFDWADDEPNRHIMPYIQWFSSMFNDKAALWFTKQISLTYSKPGSYNSAQWGAYAENLLYYTPGGSFDDVKALPLQFTYKSRALAAIRSAWAGPEGSTDSSSFHIKGGDNAWNHAHLDLGSWVFDKNGVRIADDLGADNYGLPGYFGSTRWEYYRLNTHGHNSLRFDGKDQSVSGTATLTLNSQPTGPFKKSFGGLTMTPLDRSLVIDLSNAYKSQGITHVRRGVTTMSNVTSLVFLEDIVVPATIKNITWSLHTHGKVTIAQNKKSAVISFPKETVTVTILPETTGTNCSDASIIVTAIDLPPPQYSTTGVERLDIVSFVPDKCTTLGVQVGDPYKENEREGIQSLDQWEHYGPFV